MDEKHFYSVYDNQHQLLRDALKLHNKGNLKIELDPMYNKGNFYNQKIWLPEPMSKGDINPVAEGVYKMDATNLSHSDNSVNSMILDPPFTFRQYKSNSPYVVATKYSIMKMDWNGYKEFLEKLIKEASRVLAKKGLLIFKIQDMANYHNYFTHCEVYNFLVKHNFKILDLAVLVSKNAVTNHQKNQRHFRKNHCYFWIARKGVKNGS